MGIRFHAHGSIAELMTLHNLLAESEAVLSLRAGSLYRGKDPNKAHQYFELTLRPSEKYIRVHKARDRSGFVYLIQAPDGSFKIGRSKNVRDRVKTFNVKLPFDVEFLHLIETEDMYALEKSLHRRFASKRLRGSEFFQLSSRDVDYICSL